MYVWNSSYNTERHLLQQRFLHKVNGVLPTRNRININSLSSFPRDTTKLILYINMYPGLYFHTFLADTWSVKKEKKSSLTTGISWRDFISLYSYLIQSNNTIWSYPWLKIQQTTNKISSCTSTEMCKPPTISFSFWSFFFGKISDHD